MAMKTHDHFEKKEQLMTLSLFRAYTVNKRGDYIKPVVESHSIEAAGGAKAYAT